MSTTFGEHFHIDIWGPATKQTVNHHLWVLTILDDATDWLEMPTMSKKSDAFSKLVEILTRHETQHGIICKIIQSDRDGSFTSDEITSYLKSRDFGWGMIRRQTVTEFIG